MRGMKRGETRRTRRNGPADVNVGNVRHDLG